MTLTPEDVQAVRFRTSRMRAGYRMADVDAFLDQVAATIEELGEQVKRTSDSEAVWRAQAEQLQIRLAARDAEVVARGHDTIPIPRDGLADVTAARERLRMILVEQLRLLDE